MLDKPKNSDRPDPATHVNTEAIHPFRRVYEFFKANRYTISVPVVLAALAMSLYIITARPMYTAVTHLLIDANLPNILPEQAGTFRAQLDAAQVDSQIAILQSDQIALIVMKKLQLQTDPDFLERASSLTEGPFESKTQTRRIMDAFQRELRVRRQGRSYVLEVSYQFDKPEKAAQLADATVEAYIEDLLRARADAARQGSQWLEGRIDSLRAQVNAATVKVQEFKAKRDYRFPSEGSAGPDRMEKGDRSENGKVPPQFTLDELESTAQTYRKIYEGYLQAHTDSVQRQSYPVSNARVLTHTTPYKSHPKIILLMSFALLLGTLVGFGIAVVRQALGLRPR